MPSKLFLLFYHTRCSWAGSTSAALLHLDNAIPRLLQLLAQSEDAEILAQQLDRALDAATLPANASLDDIREVVSLVSSLLPCIKHCLHSSLNSAG